MLSIVEAWFLIMRSLMLGVEWPLFLGVALAVPPVLILRGRYGR